MVIQTTIHDVVFSGHGGVNAPPIKKTTVPAGVEFWLLAPPGTFLLNHVGWSLETGEKISGLYMRRGGRVSYQLIEPMIYPHGSQLPDLMLSYGNFVPKRRVIVPHVLTTSDDMHLQDMWGRLDPFRTECLKTGRKLRVFWSACSNIDQQSEDFEVGAIDHPIFRTYTPE